MAKETEASSLHEHAVQAEKHLEALATGLAQAGASDETVKAVTQMADVARQLVTALGKGQEETGDEEAPAAEGQPKNYDEAAAQTGQMMADSAAKR